MLGPRDAAHTDVLVYSDGAGSPTLQLGALDFEDGMSFDNIRLFEGFLAPATFFGVNFYSGDEPGANAVTTASGSLPAGGSAIGGGDIFFDIAPATIDGVTGELFQWDDLSGVFTAAPSGYSLEIEGTGAIADGSAANNAATSAWETVDTNGFFHKHRDYLLFDNDGNNTTVADTGVYMLSLTARKSGFNDSLPFYLVLGAGLDETNPADELLLETAADHVGATFGVMAAEIEAVIPEPATGLVWSIGFATVMLVRKRRS